MILISYQMLGIRGRICHAIHRYAKINTKYTKTMIKINNCYILNTWDVNSLYGGAILQMLLVNDFKWVGNIPKFD